MGLGQEGIDRCVIHLRGSIVLSSWGTGSYDRSTAALKLRLQPRPRPSLTPPLCESSWLSWDAFKLSRLSSVSPGVIWARFSRELNRLRLDCGGSTARRSAVGEEKWQVMDSSCTCTSQCKLHFRLIDKLSKTDRFMDSWHKELVLATLGFNVIE